MINYEKSYILMVHTNIHSYQDVSSLIPIIHHSFIFSRENLIFFPLTNIYNEYRIENDTEVSNNVAAPG